MRSFFFFYDLLLFIVAIVSLPKWLYKKKYRGTILQRFGISLPPASEKVFTIWIHMVSLGETKAAIPMYQRLKQAYPEAAFFLSSSTKTGHEEAKRSLPSAEGYFYLPLDFSWVMRRLAWRYKPNLLFLSEGDFWPNLLRYVQSIQGKIVLINGKISETSTTRFRKIPKFSENFFQTIDCFCVQNQEYAQRFYSLQIPPEKVTITGNLKLSVPIKKLTQEEKNTWRKKLHLQEKDQVITLGSTHEGEEELLLPYLTQYTVLLVPRHPERFAGIKKYLEKKKYPNVHLICQMGILEICYQLSSCAIVGGSFLKGLKGHNLFEPIQAGIPVIFGPYVESQKELVTLILNASAGIQTPHEKLSQAIPQAIQLSSNAQTLAFNRFHPLEATWQALRVCLQSKVPYFVDTL